MKPSKPVVYIGGFPPPFGGVTIKNALLFKNLEPRVQLKKVDLWKVKRLNIISIAVLAKCLIARNGALVIGASAKMRRVLTGFLYLMNRGKMNRSLLFVMGGKVPDGQSYTLQIGEYRRVYVETEGMKATLQERGLKNVSVFPNCRERHAEPRFITVYDCHRPLRAVFFSYICREKGADTVVNAAGLLHSVEFHFYGRIEKTYKTAFLEDALNSPNVFYHGVFDPVTNDVVAELSKYDVHLFPSIWTMDGVPGIIIETKMAGVPTIASSNAYNQELIKDGVDGAIMKSNSAKELAGIVSDLERQPEKLMQMKRAALRSSESFFIDEYIDDMVANLL